MKILVLKYRGKVHQVYKMNFGKVCTGMWHRAYSDRHYSLFVAHGDIHFVREYTGWRSLFPNENLLYEKAAIKFGLIREQEDSDAERVSP